MKMNHHPSLAGSPRAFFTLLSGARLLAGILQRKINVVVRVSPSTKTCQAQEYFFTTLARLVSATSALAQRVAFPLLFLGAGLALVQPCAGTSPGTWSITGSLATARVFHTETLLPNGKVLVAGGQDSFGNALASAELYNPASGTWTATGSLTTPRYQHTATLMPDGKVLVAGGDTASPSLASAELYDPATGTWTATGSLTTAQDRFAHSATLLPNGKVLVAGGWSFLNGGNAIASAELYNPATGTWTATGSLTAARSFHPAMLLSNGKVLVAAGTSSGNNPPGPSSCLASAELYDPASGTWTATGGLATGRVNHTATLLPNGKVLVAGGFNGSIVLASAELYDPANGTWTATGSLNTARRGHTATLLPNGKVLVAGGSSLSGDLASAELYDPASGTWTATGSLNTARRRHRATLLSNGMVLVAGGFDTNGLALASAELYDPPTSTPTPVVTTNPATTVASFSATLNGSLNPRGLTTTVDFQYGPTTSYGHTTPVQTQTGNTARLISANISGLLASHVYHFRIVAHNSAGTSFGSDRTFTTLSPTGPPAVITNLATSIASFSATLNGSVDPHGLTTSVHFQYGATTSYGLTTAPQSHTGNTYLNISANTSGLLASHVYHFRIVATNSAGTTFGGDRTFTTLSATGAPVVTTNPATNVAISSATLNGSLDPHGLTTSVHFQYGTTTSYGLTTAPQSHTGNTYLNISANTSGLLASHVYHYRIVATNSAGTSSGSDTTFTTP
jgi:hypothetical protein